MKSFFVFLLLFVLPAYSAERLLGAWEIIKVVGSGSITATNDEQAHKLVGSRIVLTEHAVLLPFEQRTCKEPSYKHEKISRRAFYHDYQMKPNPLRLPPMVETADLACTEAVILPSGNIIFEWNGFFFEAKRKHDAVPPSNSKDP